MSGTRTKPLSDWTDQEIKSRLRKMHEGGNYVHAPNDYYRELERRTSVRHARISAIASVVSAIVAMAAVVLSAIALYARATPP